MTPEEQKAPTRHAVSILEINMLDILRQHPDMDRNSLQVAMGFLIRSAGRLTVAIADRLVASGQVRECLHSYKYLVVSETP